MLSVLVISPPDPDVDRLATGHPSIEILQANDTEEALEKLGRNRRIDAILIAGWDSPGVAGIVAEIREDNPAPPPVFVLGGGAGAPGVRILPAGPLEAALDALERELNGGG